MTVDRATSSPLKLHHMLHGYDGGHRRIAGSIMLPTEAERLLLRLTDLSGASMVSGFESYVTGYPVPDTDFYAIARTWYADEMPRPGCVWTHTLLLENVDVARMRTPAALLRLFRRPVMRWLSYYASPLKCDTEPTEDAAEAAESAPSAADREVVEALVYALYRHPDRPILVSSKAAEGWDRALLSIWAQQWPRLRRGFAFSTGSIQDRNRGRVKFDVQVVPREAASVVVRAGGGEYKPLLIQGDRVAGAGGVTPKWAQLISTCLFEPWEEESIALHRFAAAAGAESRTPRALFAPLADIYAAAVSAPGSVAAAKAALDRCSLWMPHPKQGARAKAILFGRKSVGGEAAQAVDWFSVTEADLIEAIVTSREADCLDPSRFELRARTLELAEIDAGRVVNILKSVSQEWVSDLTRQFIEAAGAVLSSEDVVAGIDGRQPLLEVVLESAPRHALAWVVWESFPGMGRILLEAMRHYFARDGGRLSTGDLKSAVGVVTRYGSGADIADAPVFVPHLDPHDVIAEAAHVRGAAAPWPLFLTRFPSDVAKWVGEFGASMSVQTAASVVEAADLTSTEFQAIPAKAWIGVAKPLIGVQRAERRIMLVAYFVAIGLKGDGPDSDELLASAFDHLYREAARGPLPGGVRRMLDQAIGKLSRDLEWDQCLRLRRKLAERVVERGSDPRVIVLATQDPDVLREAVNLASETEGGRRWLVKLRETVARNPGLFSESQKRVIPKPSSQKKKWSF